MRFTVIKGAEVVYRSGATRPRASIEQTAPPRGKC
jgi:hypothetical protein